LLERQQKGNKKGFLNGSLIIFWNANNWGGDSERNEQGGQTTRHSIRNARTAA
jgi:hypothetical protein